MKDKLSFLEKELGIKMQYKLLDQVEVIPIIIKKQPNLV